MGGVVIVIWCDTLCGVTKSTNAAWIVLAAAEHVLWLKLCTGSLASWYIVVVCIMTHLTRSSIYPLMCQLSTDLSSHFSRGGDWENRPVSVLRPKREVERGHSQMTSVSS